jgi:hypothetical protein
MKIEYAENPLASKIYLDDSEKKLLFWKYKWDLLGDEIYGFYYWMKEPEKQKAGLKEHNNVQGLEAYEKLEQSMLFDPLNTVYEKLDKISENMSDMQYDESVIKDFIEALQESHHGDCISQCCSCLKCYVEDQLDMDYDVPNFREQSGHAIHGAFFKPDQTIEQAIDYLKNKDFNTAEILTYQKEVVDRWKQENSSAIEYLEYYKKEILKR